MIIHSGDMEAWKIARWAGKRPILEFYGWLNLLVLWIFGAVWAAMLNLFPALDPAVVPAGVVLIAVVIIIRTYFGFQESAEDFADAYLKPLGLQVANRPVIKPRPLALLIGGQAGIPAGSAVLKGVRAGRSVRIELVDQNTRTLVLGTTPHFAIQSRDGKLTAGGEAPEVVRGAVNALRKARRWKGFQVEAGPDRIAIDRQSRKQNMWLYDLWLAEHLLDQLEES